MGELELIIKLRGGVGYPRSILKKAGTDIRKGTFDQAIKYCLNREGLNDKEEQVAGRIEENMLAAEISRGKSGELSQIRILVTMPGSGTTPVSREEPIEKYIHTAEVYIGGKPRKYDALEIRVERDYIC